MSRSEEEIVEELKNSIRSTDKTLDVEQGPLPDIFIRPQAGQIATSSEEAESLRQLFTLQFEDSATDEEVRNALANYGSTPGAGIKARHIQHFMRFTRPQDDISIPAGTLVSNTGGNLVYRVVDGGTILVSAADSFFNSTRNSFEIGLLVEAVGIGVEFNLPQFRVSSLITPVEGIDSTENRSASVGGDAAETKEAQAERLKVSLKGLNLGAPGGIESQIKDAKPETVTDVAVVQPFEKEFTRTTSGPALDVYVIGETIEIASQTFTAIGGETQIQLTNVPAIAVTSLTVNDISGVITFTLVSDTTPESGSSLNAVDLVILDSTLLVGDIVVIEYTFNKTLADVQTDVFADGTEFLFNTEILVREPFQVAPIIGGEIQALASFSVTEVEQNVLTFFAIEFTFTTFIETVFPEVIRQRVITEVSGVQNFLITEFRRATGSLSTIGPLVYARNEVSVFDVDLFGVTVVS